MGFEKGDIVAIRDFVPGTFGGIESDWRAAVYEGRRNGKCVVSYLPVTAEFGCPSEDEVFESALEPPEKYWPWLKGMRMIKAG